jgi:hypothetical protein
MNVDQHPSFATWLVEQSDDLDLYGELLALIRFLETKGADDLDGYDECHPVVTSPYLYALRRTPPTMSTPYAEHPPVIRMLFALTLNNTDDISAVLLLGGDKTRLGNFWYPPNTAQAHSRLTDWTNHTRTRPLQQRGTRR